MDEKELSKAKEAALKFLSYGMKTEKQVADKLAEKEFAEDVIAGTITYLKELRYVDDMNYAQSYIKYAEAKGHGSRRIKDEMIKRGIDRFTVEDAFYEYEQIRRADGFEVMSEAERAEAEAMHIAEGKTVDDKLIAKVGRRLKTLGFESEAIYQAVGKVMKMKKNGENDFE